MKKWENPKIITIREKELKSMIIAGACSDWCIVSWFRELPED